MSSRLAQKLAMLQLEHGWLFTEMWVCYKVLWPLTGKLYRPWEKRREMSRERVEEIGRKLDRLNKEAGK